jgi:hypothetical protein
VVTQNRKSLRGGGSTKTPLRVILAKERPRPDDRTGSQAKFKLGHPSMRWIIMPRGLAIVALSARSFDILFAAASTSAFIQP